MEKNGFTLTELLIVVVVISILASVGFPEYLKVMEKGRSSEARTILGQIRSGETAYYMEYNQFTNNAAALQFSVPSSCSATHYFSYGISVSGTTFTATAARCTASGKFPNSAIGAYSLNITDQGVLGGNATIL